MNFNRATFIFQRFTGHKKRLFRFVYQHCYGAQDLLIGQTAGMRDSLVAELGFVPAKKFVVVKNLVSKQSLAPHPTPAEATYDEGRLIVACGRLIPLKGFDRLIEAFASVELAFNWRLVIIGDGPDYQRLLGLITKHGLHQRVRLLGRLETPYDWFSVADVGVISSDREGFPNTILEMMACGTKRLVSTPCTDGLTEVPHLLLTSDLSTASLAEALRAAIATDASHVSTYRKYILEHHTAHSFWSTVTKSIETDHSS